MRSERLKRLSKHPQEADLNHAEDGGQADQEQHSSKAHKAYDHREEAGGDQSGQLVGQFLNGLLLELVAASGRVDDLPAERLTILRPVGAGRESGRLATGAGSC